MVEQPEGSLSVVCTASGYHVLRSDECHVLISDQPTGSSPEASTSSMAMSCQESVDSGSQFQPESETEKKER